MCERPASLANAMATLSEFDSKRLLVDHGLPVLPERSVATAVEAVAAADELGYPCVMKLSGDQIAHKTERNLVRLSIGGRDQALDAATELLAAATPDDGAVTLLVAPMVSSSREFIVGAQRSAEFGAVVMVGIGGIFAEALEDVSFRMLPASTADVQAMLDDLRTGALLEPFRGEPAVDRAGLVRVIESVAQAMLDRDDIVAIDVNPVLINNGQPVAVDALVEVA